jgi:ribosome-binding ATPase YchF (GTP1/OBG family)
VPAIRIGLIGKTNTGKTTFYNAATLQSAEVSSYPFTTKVPNIGVTNALTLCVHKEFNVKDNPRNSKCLDGWRYIPVEIIDLPGLIKGASMGKGLGNQFLSVATQSDALLHVVDASGSVDAEGKVTEPGDGDPIADISDIEEELVMWYLKLIESNRDKISKEIRLGKDISEAVSEILAGMGVKQVHVVTAVEKAKLAKKTFDNWSDQDTRSFAWTLREESKPTLVVANKMDLPHAAENFKRLREYYSDLIVVPVSGEAELTLRRAQQKDVIKYIPGEERFEILERASLTKKQLEALGFIRKAILGEYMRTGVQFAINTAVFKILRMNSVYPVSDPEKFADKDGNVLPDVYLLPSGSTVVDLARSVHTELAKGILYAMDSRSGLRLPADYQLKDRDVLSVVSASRKK